MPPSPPLKTLVSRHFHSILKPQTPAQLRTNPLYNPSSNPSIPLNAHNLLSFRTFIHRSLSTSLQIDDRSEPESCAPENAPETNEKKKKKKKKVPLSLFFKQAVGLSEKIEISEDESEDSESESGKLKKKLKELEMEVRRLKEIPKNNIGLKKKVVENVSVVKEESLPVDSLYALCKDYNVGDQSHKEPASSLYAVFRNSKVFDKSSEEKKALKQDDPLAIRDLSEDMVVFVRHLYDAGYMVDANFFPDKQFDAACFRNSYGREFVKFAAEKLGKDNQEIGKWLSGSDLKKVALFGCPSTAKKAVFSAKRLRFFFGIEEDSVCKSCVLNQSCEFMNHKLCERNDMKLVLVDVMRVIILYGLESTPPQLVLSNKLKASVSRLLKEVASLS